MAGPVGRPLQGQSGLRRPVDADDDRSLVAQHGRFLLSFDDPRPSPWPRSVGTVPVEVQTLTPIRRHGGSGRQRRKSQYTTLIIAFFFLEINYNLRPVSSKLALRLG